MSEAVRKSTNSAVGNPVSSTAAKLNVWIIARLSDVFRFRWFWLRFCSVGEGCLAFLENSRTRMIESIASDGTIILMKTIYRGFPRSIRQMAEMTDGSTLNLLGARRVKTIQVEES